MQPQDQLRKTILASVLDVVKRLDARVRDDYPIKVTDAYMELLRRINRLPTEGEWLRRAFKIKTRFYQENSPIRKEHFLKEIGRELRRNIERTNELKTLLFSHRRIFISHSNIFPTVVEHFVMVVRRSGFEPVVAERSPNLGRSWSPGQKVKTLMRQCRALVAILTPDDSQTREPRLNVVHEIGLAQGIPIPIVYLKAKEAKLPSNINPVYISFELKFPAKANVEFDSNLRALGL